MGQKTVLTIADITNENTAFIISRFNDKKFKQYQYGNVFHKDEIEEKFMPIIQDVDHIDEIRILLACHEYKIEVINKKEISKRKITKEKIENYLCNKNNVSSDDIQYSYTEPNSIKDSVVTIWTDKKKYQQLKERYARKYKAVITHCTIPEVGINTHYKKNIKNEKIMTLNELNDNLLVTIADKENLLFSYSLTMPKNNEEFKSVSCQQINSILSDIKENHHIMPEYVALNVDKFTIDINDTQGKLKLLKLTPPPMDISEFRTDNNNTAILLSALGIGGHDG